jgi:hypothetical protein
MTTTATKPGTTVCASKNCVPKPGSAHGSNVKTGLLLKPNVGTYDNGYEPAGAAYGDSNTDEGNIYQCEIRGKHPRTTTPYDKNSQAFTAGDAILVVRHEQDKEYWLPASSITVSVGDKLICAASGLVEQQTDHSNTPLPHHTWVCTKAASSKDWVRARYMGITSMKTA